MFSHAQATYHPELLYTTTAMRRVPFDANKSYKVHLKQTDRQYMFAIAKEMPKQLPLTTTTDTCASH
eukprot:6492156-Amphidinium_carterae.2